MLDLGRVCIKLLGRDAGKECVIIKILDNKYVLIDGNTRRKRVNIKHIEPLSKTIKIKEEATTEEVLKAFEESAIPVTKKLTDKKDNKEKKEDKKKNR